MNIACVIPAYNEERFIGAVIAAIPDFIGQIIVVNDASRDGTAAVVRGLAHPRVTLIDLPVNQGVGGAVLTGYRKALELGADIVIKLDGDGQMDPDHIQRLIAPIRQGLADYCKGVRFRDASVLRRMPVARLIGNLGLSFLTKTASGYWNIFDPANGFTAIGRPALELLELDRIGRCFFFETDMLINLYMIDAVVLDVPMRARYGEEESSLSPARILLSFPLRLFRAFCRRILWRYFIRDFTAFSAFFLSGLLLMGYGFVFGVYQWLRHALVLGVATPTGTIMLAVVPFILGFQLLLQAVVLDIQNVPATPLQRSRAEVGEDIDEPFVAGRR